MQRKIQIKISQSKLCEKESRTTVAKKSLKDFYKENPHKTKKSFLDREEYQDLIEEALDGIKKWNPSNYHAQWLMSEAPDINVKFHTIRQGLLHRAKEIT